jgi:hypothetical protein
MGVLQSPRTGSHTLDATGAAVSSSNADGRTDAAWPGDWRRGRSPGAVLALLRDVSVDLPVRHRRDARAHETGAASSSGGTAAVRGDGDGRARGPGHSPVLPEPTNTRTTIDRRSVQRTASRLPNRAEQKPPVRERAAGPGRAPRALSWRVADRVGRVGIRDAESWRAGVCRGVGRRDGCLDGHQWLDVSCALSVARAVQGTSRTESLRRACRAQPRRPGRVWHGPTPARASS